MDQKVFEQQVLTEMQERLPELHFELRDVEKFQSGSYHALAVSREGRPVIAMVNLAPFHTRTEAGADYDFLMDELADKAIEAIRASSVIDPESFSDYGKIKDQLSVQMVNADSSRPLLDQYPHRIIGDMAMIARIDWKEKDGQGMSAAVTNGMLASFGISQETLFEDAIACGMEKRPATLRTIREELESLAGTPLDVEGSSVPGFWVASNKEKVNGAASVFYPGFLDEAAKQLGSDFFVIPSSIHEMLLLPDDGTIRADALAHIQHEVNEDEVLPEDLLSRQVFYYDAAERKLELASEHEARMAAEKAAERNTGWMDEPLYEDPLDPEELPWPDAEPFREETIRVLLVESESYPREVEIKNDLSGLQEAVGGMIETVYPFEDEACIVCNDNGKIDGLPPNRALRDDKGGVADVIAGSFLIVGLQADGFRSLEDDQISRYEKQFHQPEAFVRMGKGVMAIPIPDASVRTKETGKTEAARDAEPKAAGSGTERKDTLNKEKNRARHRPER